MTKMRLNILPTSNEQCAIRALSDYQNIVLPTLGIKAFPRLYEIVVVDLACELVHTIVVRQNGDVGVDL